MENGILIYLWSLIKNALKGPIYKALMLIGLQYALWDEFPDVRDGWTIIGLFGFSWLVVFLLQFFNAWAQKGWSDGAEKEMRKGVGRVIEMFVNLGAYYLACVWASDDMVAIIIAAMIYAFIQSFLETKAP